MTIQEEFYFTVCWLWNRAGRTFQCRRGKAVSAAHPLPPTFPPSGAPSPRTNPLRPVQVLQDRADQAQGLLSAHRCESSSHGGKPPKCACRW